MEILNKLSNELKKENIVLKNKNAEKKNFINQKIEKEKIIDEKEEIQLSLIKENSDSNNSINEVIDKSNDIEISIVEQEKLEEKEKNILQIQNLINSCKLDLQYIDKEIRKYKNSSNDLMMESDIAGFKSMVFINKKEEEEKSELDDSHQKMMYFQNLKKEYISLKTKLEELLALYKTEKEFTEIKKYELEKLDNIKNEYKKLKIKI